MKLATKVTEVTAYEILNKLQRKKVRVKWMGTGAKPGFNIPYRKWPAMIRYLVVDSKGVLEYHGEAAKQDDGITVVDEQEFIDSLVGKWG
jgi:hypothetical protein